MTIEEARVDLMLAQADILYRPKDETIDVAIEALNNQKIGHWKETTLANGRKGMKCSNCGCEPIEDVIYGYVYSDYCPNCGAKMEGEQSMTLDELDYEYNQRQRAIVEEIEKLKAEIDDFDIIEVSDPIKMGFNTMQRIALKVLDDHISELKGESNE